MFVCEKCAEKNLSNAGKKHWFAQSHGRCELCEKIGDCKDVWSGANWAWKNN